MDAEGTESGVAAGLVGLGAGLVQTRDQVERARGYRYYVEQAAALPGFVGAHWFTWRDEPVLGRNDGENYNIGFVDVTDRPYPELIEGVKATMKRLADVHSGSRHRGATSHTEREVLQDTMQPKRKLLLLFLALPLLAQQSASTSLKLPGIPARDASILADADSRTYFLYTSLEAPAGSVVAYKSKDLTTWQGPTSVFQVPPESWAKPAEGVRDPRVYAYRGKYYLFATLFNSDSIIAKPPDSWRVNTTRGTQLFVGESPLGPFSVVPSSANKPYTPADFVALGGSLYIEGDLAWLIYVHDWTQVIDATIDAVRLKADLSAPVEAPIYLFKASDAPWLQQQTAASREPRYYPAGGPFVYRTRNGSVIIIWSGPRNGKSAVTVARSVTGKVRGPWKQGATLLSDDSAQATVFKTFDGRTMMLFSQPAVGGGARAKLVELEDVGDTVRLKPAAAKSGGVNR